jgi:hypothetical protein
MAVDASRIMMPMCYHHDVRTTLTLDEDVIAKLREDMRRTGKSFKETVNENLRVALTFKTGQKPRKKFVVHARNMGKGPASSFVSASELIEFLEGPLHR